jgi:hypothetical protein
MRRPDDRRWMEVASDDWLVVRLRCAVSELMLLLMMAATLKLLQAWVSSGIAADLESQRDRWPT